MSTNLNIISGPTWDKLVSSLRYTYDKDVNIDIRFGIESGEQIKINRIYDLGYEDGSGQSYNILADAVLPSGESKTVTIWYYIGKDYQKGSITIK